MLIANKKTALTIVWIKSKVEIVNCFLPAEYKPILAVFVCCKIEMGLQM